MPYLETQRITNFQILSLKSLIWQADTSIPWLSEALVLFTVALQFCQQLKDKVSVFTLYQDMQVVWPLKWRETSRKNAFLCMGSFEERLIALSYGPMMGFATDTRLKFESLFRLFRFCKLPLMPSWRPKFNECSNLPLLIQIWVLFCFYICWKNDVRFYSFQRPTRSLYLPYLPHRHISRNTYP